MEMNEWAYEPPKARIYRFDDNDLILTASGEQPRAEFAANALNQLLGGVNTTIEKK